jgi:hypothetical protein
MKLRAIIPSDAEMVWSAGRNRRQGEHARFATWPDQRIVSADLSIPETYLRRRNFIAAAPCFRSRPWRSAMSA